MILPTKKLRPENSLIYIGGTLLSLLDDEKTVSRLWEEFRHERTKKLGIDGCDIPFDWFVLALDLLHLLGAVNLSAGRLSRSE